MNSQTFIQHIYHSQPTARLVKLLLGWWLVVCVITAFGIIYIIPSNIFAYLLISCQIILAIFALIVLVDYLLLMALSQVKSYQFQRNHNNNVAIFHKVTINLQLDFIPSRLNIFYAQLIRLFAIKQIFIELQDDYPNQFQLVTNNSLIYVNLPLTQLTQLYDNYGKPYEQAYRHTLDYTVNPINRGLGQFGNLFIRVYSPLGLMRKKFTLPSNNQNTIRVLADFSNILTNQLSAVFTNPYQMGIQPLKKEGQSSEFLDLREYQVGDSIRQIDWKVSSRYRKLMSKAYEEESDQDVVFLVDCGEQMRYQYDNDQLSYFDKVLNAVLLLSYIANKQGDRVGLMTFGGVDKVLLPTKGNNLIRHLLNETADINPTQQTSDYLQAIDKIQKIIKKRSLIILITNTRQEASDEVIHAIKRLSHKHQLIFANLTEQAIQDKLDIHAMPISTDDALLYHTLHNYQQTRFDLHKKISHHSNALCVNSTADQLAYILTSAYWHCLSNVSLG